MEVGDQKLNVVSILAGRLATKLGQPKSFTTNLIYGTEIELDPDKSQLFDIVMCDIYYMYCENLFVFKASILLYAYMYE